MTLLQQHIEDKFSFDRGAVRRTEAIGTEVGAKVGAILVSKDGIEVGAILVTSDGIENYDRRNDRENSGDMAPHKL